ncbi:MAG: peptidylprolyl isomerase [Lacinutrix sp.]|uniref:peptidylprolyl isomerase n=1 Tax=Lacinutrix sp. TaxID=1937692 RepID=UPI00309F18F8
MRGLLLFCVLLLFNCEDKQSKSKKTEKIVTKTDTILPEPEEKVIEIDSSKLTLEERYLPLNDDNAMEFFGEYGEIYKENKVRIYTRFGNIDLELFNKTKYHRANFIFLTKNKIFDGTQFHRVVKDFVIQGGNSDNIDILRKRKNIGRYLLPPDVRHGYKHRRGIISIPSGEIRNAYKLASPFEFFITQSNQFHLDGEYTAFGHVTRGLEVVDKITEQEVDGGHWPINNVYITKIEIID